MQSIRTVYANKKQVQAYLNETRGGDIVCIILLQFKQWRKRAIRWNLIGSTPVSHPISAHMPRDTHDNLFHLILCLIMGPHLFAIAAIFIFQPIKRAIITRKPISSEFLFLYVDIQQHMNRTHNLKLITLERTTKIFI